MAAVVSCFREITKENHWMPQFNYVFQGVSACMAPFGNFASPLWSCSLSFLSPFYTSLFYFSLAFFFSQLPFFSFVSFPVSPFFLCPCLWFFNPRPLYPSVLFYIPCSLLHHSDSFLLCFTLLQGQVAEQLVYYVHVSETVITEETFDAAMWFGTVRADPTQSCAG